MGIGEREGNHCTSIGESAWFEDDGRLEIRYIGYMGIGIRKHSRLLLRDAVIGY